MREQINLISDDGILLFGKYEGETLEYVLETDLMYLEWCRDKMISILDEDRDIIRIRLERHGDVELTDYFNERVCKLSHGS